MSDNSISVDTVLRMNAREAVPDSARVPSISSSSLVQGRNTVKFTPSNGKSFMPNQQAVIRLNSAQGYLAPTSTALVMDLTVTGIPPQNKEATSAYFDDLCLGVLDRFRLTAGGVLLDEIFECGKTTTALNYLTVSPDHYNGAQNVLMKSWKYVAEAEDGDDETDAIFKMMPFSKVGVQKRGSAIQSNANKSSIRVVIPMSYLSSVCRSHKFLPLRNMGNLEFSFQFAAAQNALVNSSNAASSTAGNPDVTAPTLGYSVDNIYMLADIVDLNAEYVSMMDRLLQGEGMTIPLDKYTVLSAQNNINQQSVKKQFTYSFGAPVVKNCVFWKQLASQQNNINSFTTSAFLNNNQKSFRLRVGSQYLPQYDSIQSNEELYWMTQKGLGVAGNIGEQIGLGNYKSFTSNDAANATFIFMFSFEKNSESADVVLDGIDARSTSLFVAEIEDSIGAGNDIEELYCAFNSIAVLKLANGVLVLEE